MTDTLLCWTCCGLRLPRVDAFDVGLVPATGWTLRFLRIRLFPRVGHFAHYGSAFTHCVRSGSRLLNFAFTHTAHWLPTLRFPVYLPFGFTPTGSGPLHTLRCHPRTHYGRVTLPRWDVLTDPLFILPTLPTPLVLPFWVGTHTGYFILMDHTVQTFRTFVTPFALPVR